MNLFKKLKMTEYKETFYNYRVIASCYDELNCKLRTEHLKIVKSIPLLLTLNEVKKTFNKLKNIPNKTDIPFDYFHQIVAGAALFSMKELKRL